MTQISSWFERRRRALTVVELAVAVSVVGALVVTLLPALKEARTSSISSACLGNQMAIGTAFHQYVADYDYLPGQNPNCYGTGAQIFPVGNSATGPFWGTSVNLWSDVAVENDPGFNDGVDFTTTPILPSGFQTTAVGHGTLAAYLSNDGTVQHANHRVYYCPGTKASFHADPGFSTESNLVPNPSWYPFYWDTSALGQTNIFNPAYGGYYEGWAQFGAPSSYLNWINAGKPINQYDCDNVCLSTYTWRGGEWTYNKNLPITDNAGWTNNWTYNQLQRPSSPNVQQRITMSCFWWNGYFSFNQTTNTPGGNHPENIPHDGKSVNNLWTDGHAATYTLPANQPVAVWTWYAFDSSPNQATFNPTDPQEIGGFYYQMPFWWGLADQQAP